MTRFEFLTSLFFFFLMIRPPPRSTLFPYTTLFRSLEFLDLAAPVLQKIADTVLLSNRGTQEAELCGLPDDQPELPLGHHRLGAFLHPKGHHAERLQRSFHSWDGWHRTFDSDVVRARGATPDSNSLSVPGPSVIGRPSRHCMLEVRRFQNIGRTKRFKSLFGQPAIEHLYQPPPQHVRLHDAPIEQNMRRACQTV